MRLLRVAVWTTFCGFGAWGWLLGATELLRPPVTRELTITVTQESFDRAHKLCARYMHDSRGVVFGQTNLTTLVGENIVLPCGVVLKEEKR